MSTPASREPSRTLELLWGLTTPPSRGPKPALSVDKIVEKAVEIADAEGLSAVSMRRIADDLGFTTMSLYRYVPSKDDLLELMLDAAAMPYPDFDAMPAHWREALTWWAHEAMAMFRRHPWFLDIPFTGPPMGPHQVHWMEHVLRPLAGTGLSGAEMMGVLELLSTYTLSAARLEIYLTESAPKTGVSPDDWDVLYGQMLAKVVDPAEHPTVAQVFGFGGEAGDSAGNDDRPVADDIAFGLDVILDGVDVLIERRQRRR